MKKNPEDPTIATRSVGYYLGPEADEAYMRDVVVPELLRLSGVKQKAIYGHVEPKLAEKITEVAGPGDTEAFRLGLADYAAEGFPSEVWTVAMNDLKTGKPGPEQQTIIIRPVDGWEKDPPDFEPNGGIDGA